MSGMSKITVVLMSRCLLHMPVRGEPGMESLVRVCVRVCVCVCVCVIGRRTHWSGARFHRACTPCCREARLDPVSSGLTLCYASESPRG